MQIFRVFFVPLYIMITITKIFHLEMAHALYQYVGACENIHGHSYRLEVTVSGEINNDPEHPMHGMILDFGVLKQIVQTSVIDVFDHALILNSQILESKIGDSLKNIGNIVPVTPAGVLVVKLR